jgi:hypothetical protein
VQIKIKSEILDKAPIKVMAQAIKRRINETKNFNAKLFNIFLPITKMSAFFGIFQKLGSTKFTCSGTEGRFV